RHLARQSEIHESVLRSGLFEEFRAVARGDLDAATLVVAQHLERQSLARLVAPQRQVQLLPAGDFLGIERDDHVALLQATTLTRSFGHDAGDHDALVDGVREDAEPRAARPADDAAVAQQLALVLAVAV